MIRNPGETFPSGGIEPVHFPVVHPDELPFIDRSLPLLDMTVGPDGAEVVQTLAKIRDGSPKNDPEPDLNIVRLELPGDPAIGQSDNEVVADPLSLPFADESFGTVVTHQSTYGLRYDMHNNPWGTENRHRLESEIMRVLRVGGLWIAHEELAWDPAYYPQKPVEGKTIVSANMRMGQVIPGVAAHEIILATYRRGEVPPQDAAASAAPPPQEQALDRLPPVQDQPPTNRLRLHVGSVVTLKPDILV